MKSLQLLTLKDRSRLNPNEQARRYVEPLEMKIIVKFYQLAYPLMVKELWKRAAILGSFLGGKSNGKPEWQTMNGVTMTTRYGS